MPISGGPGPSGAQTYPTTADLATHAADTTSIHGISDTSALETTTGSAAKVETHRADTTSVHGINDTSFLKKIVVTDSTYGATGDGVTNDTAALQAALDAVDTNTGLVDVWIPDGTYLVTGPTSSYPDGVTAQTRNKWVGGGLLPKAGTRLHLSPDAILKIVPNAQPGYSCIYLGSDQSDVQILGGQILGDRATHDYATEPTYTTHEWGNGVSIDGASDVLIEGVSISGFTGDGIFIDAEGVVSDGEGYIPPLRTVIRGCAIDASRRNNISALGFDQLLIENCTITRAGFNDGIKAGTAPKAGIDIESNGDSEDPLRVTIRNNKFEGNVTQSITAYNAEQCIITGNWSDGNFSVGFGTEVVITDNVIVNTSDTTSVAIGSEASQVNPAHTIISGNLILGFGTAIKVQRDSVMVKDNFLGEFTDYGVDLSTCDLATVQDNQIYDGAATDAVGVRLTGTTNTDIVGNRFHDVYRGISWNTASTGISVRGNAFRKMNVGVSMTGASQSVIKDNSFYLPGHSTGQSYDVVWTSTCDVICEGNTFRGSTTYSINATSGGSGGVARILGNTIVDNTAGTSIICTGGAPEVIGNTIIHNRASSVTGAILLGATTSGARILSNTIYNVGAGALTGIHTDSATTSNIAGNVIDGTITSDATDTLTNNSLI